MHNCQRCDRDYPSELAADRCCMEPPRWDDDTWH